MQPGSFRPEVISPLQLLWVARPEQRGTVTTASYEARQLGIHLAILQPELLRQFKPAFMRKLG